jgi:hypothetical protein
VTVVIVGQVVTAGQKRHKGKFVNSKASVRAFGLEAYRCIDRVDLVLGLSQHSCSQLQVI